MAGPIGQRHDLLLDDDALDVPQALFVERQDGIARELHLLELGDDGPVIARGELALARDPRGDRRHLGLIFFEGGMRFRGDVGGREIDAVLLECERVFLGGQTKVRARLRQQIALDPGVVFGELGLQLCIGILPAGQPILLEERADAFDVVRVAPELGFELGLGRIVHPRLRHLLLDTLFVEPRDGHASRLDAGVFPQPDHRRRAALRGHLVIQEDFDAPKDSFARIEIGHVEADLLVELAIAEVGGVDEDLYVLSDLAVLHERQLRLDLADDRIALGARGEVIRERGRSYESVVLGESLCGSILRRMLQMHVDQHLSEVVACLDPWRGREGVQRRGEESQSRKPC